MIMFNLTLERDILGGRRSEEILYCTSAIIKIEEGCPCQNGHLYNCSGVRNPADLGSTLGSTLD
jgi:hypothetical protein